MGTGGEATFAVIAGGGTAGHVLPGVAVARALVDRGHSPSSVHFVGSERGPEGGILAEAGFAATLLPGRGIQRRLAWENVGAVVGIIRAMGGAFRCLRRLRPRVVLALGGYASVAATLSAVVLRIPIVVTEQNARAGLASRLAARFARAAAVPFPETDLPRAVVTGNPVRPEVLAVARGEVDRDEARSQLGLPTDRTVIAVFSGSLGSRRVNDAIIGAARQWQGRTDLAVRHVVGVRDFDQLEAAGPASGMAGLGDGDGLVYQRVRYEGRMDLLLAAADLAVCRAGGTTVAELAAVGLPAVLVPLPIATRDHQTANAGPLVRAGAAVLVADHDLDAQRLRHEVEAMLAAPGGLAARAAAARGLAHLDAADRLADLLEEHARGR